MAAGGAEAPVAPSDPASADTSFFIVTGGAPSLDGIEAVLKDRNFRIVHLQRDPIEGADGRVSCTLPQLVDEVETEVAIAS